MSPRGKPGGLWQRPRPCDSEKDHWGVVTALMSLSCTQNHCILFCGQLIMQWINNKGWGWNELTALGGSYSAGTSEAEYKQQKPQKFFFLPKPSCRTLFANQLICKSSNINGCESTEILMTKFHIFRVYSPIMLCCCMQTVIVQCSEMTAKFKTSDPFMCSFCVIFGLIFRGDIFFTCGKYLHYITWRKSHCKCTVEYTVDILWTQNSISFYLVVYFIIS